MAPGVIRMHPTRILAFGIEEDGPGSRWVRRPAGDTAAGTVAG